MAYRDPPLLRLLHSVLILSRRVLKWLTRAKPAAETVRPASAVPAPRSVGLAEIREFVAEEWVDRRWVRRVARLGRALGRRRRYEAVISCGPPHMSHVAAARVARSLRLPLVLDLRDLWSITEAANRHRLNPLYIALARRYERRCVDQAALVIMNTEAARDAMRTVHPHAAERIQSVMNGFDQEWVPAPRHGPCFKMIYAGSIYLDRSPLNWFRATAALVSSEGLGPDHLRIELIGNATHVRGISVEGMAKELGLGDHVVLLPPCSRKELFSRLAEAAMLVNLPQSYHVAIPSKVFEYLLFPAWVLALATPDSATGRVLAGTGADVVDPDDVRSIQRVIAARYAQYRSGERPSPLSVRNPHLSRRAQAERLFALLDDTLTATKSQPG
jgi:glycosyltransferase involved in cell wall biosynthesis